jgi:hypothetical protein
VHPSPRRDIDVIGIVPHRRDEAIVQECGEALDNVKGASDQHQDGREQEKAGNEQPVLRLAGACGTVCFSLGSHWTLLLKSPASQGHGRFQYSQSVQP